jgi:hypothetical protein
MNSRQRNLLEGKILLEARVTRKLWESAGQRIVEAELTPNQIKQLFQQVEQGVTAGGSNRTVVGKTKDATDAINKAWEDLKTKIQNSKPMTNFDQAISDQLSKIGMGAKDPQFNGQVSQWVQKYRDFAKKHPIAQGAIYGTLIALTGLTGVGIPGAAALGLLKMADKVLQGERFTSAAYSGAKTGAMAYAAGQIGQHLKGRAASGSQPTAGDNSPEITDYSQNYSGESIANMPVIPGQPLNARQLAVANMSMSMGNHLSPDAQAAYDLAKKIGAAASPTASAATQVPGNFEESRQLSESQIYVLFGMMNGLTVQIDEGILDWAKTKGHNLTTKVTVDKLTQAWKKAGSPTDSGAIAKILTSAGVPQETITSIFSSMSIPTSAPANTTGPQSSYQFIIKILPKLTTQEKTNLLALLQK